MVLSNTISLNGTFGSQSENSSRILLGLDYVDMATLVEIITIWSSGNTRVDVGCRYSIATDAVVVVLYEYNFLLWF